MTAANNQLPHVTLKEAVLGIPYDLLDKGAIIINEQHEEQDFSELVRRIGNILLITPVKIVRNTNAPVLYTANRMFPHTDTPAADVVGWYCVAQGLENEGTVLIDTKELLESYAPDMIGHLSQIRCRVPDKNNAPTKFHLQYESHPLLEVQQGRVLLNYTPYLNFELDNESQRDALERLTEDLRALEKSARVVRLQQGQGLLIDNRRFLHCRTDLDPRSPRCHYRYLIEAKTAH